MPAARPLPIAPPPGIVKTESERVAAGRFVDGDMMRFVRGRAEKRGGWVKAYAAATSGTPRAIHAWRDLSANQFLAAGTYRKLYVYDTNNGQNDVTPFRATGTLPSNPFTAAAGSSIVTVNHPNHGTNSGDTVIFSGASGVGGINPNGTFVVIAATLNTYTFDSTITATSSTSGGGSSVAFSYEIPSGTELGVYGLGWGVGPWGLGPWGTARPSSTIFIEPRVWSLDHFGKILIAAYNGGSIYRFDPSQAQPWPRASLISADPNLPSDANGACRFMFVTPERFVVALRENMQVSWCTQGDPFAADGWTPAPTNTANTRTLTEGTKLVAGRALGPFVSLIWSDAACYLMQWTGSKYVHDTRLIGRNCGLIAPGAAVTVNGVAYWMGHETFLTYDGSIHPMANVEDIRKFVFDAVKRDYGYQCSAVYNPKHHEIEFFYTVTGETNPTRSVIYAIADQCWSPQNLGRAAGTNFTQGDTRPYMAGTDAFIYQHENTYDDDGAALAFRLKLAPTALDGAAALTDIEGFEADFKDQVGALTLTLTARDRLRDAAAIETETATIGPSDTLVDLRATGRYLDLEVAGNAVGGFFRWGEPQALVKPAGTRR
jgi:hypothetical protein